MNKSFSLLFYLKRSKISKDGSVPIYLRITIDGLKIEIATKRWIDPVRWNSSTQKATGTNDESRSINSFLKTFEQQVYSHYEDLLKKGTPITPKLLKSKILGLDSTKRNLIKVFENHNKQIEALVGDGPANYAHATWTKYNTTVKHLKE